MEKKELIICKVLDINVFIFSFEKFIARWIPLGTPQPSFCLAKVFFFPSPPPRFSFSPFFFNSFTLIQLGTLFSEKYRRARGRHIDVVSLVSAGFSAEWGSDNGWGESLVRYWHRRYRPNKVESVRNGREGAGVKGRLGRGGKRGKDYLNYHSGAA